MIAINEGRLRIQRCWGFSSDEKPPYPTIDIWVARSKEEDSAKFTFKVDTGFSGIASLSDKVISDLGLERYGTTLIATAADITEVPIYRVLLTQKELKLSKKQVTALGTARCLIGRMLLTKNSWLLDFVNDKFCLLTSRSS